TLGRFEICGRAYKMFFDPEAKEWFDAPTRLDVYFHPSKKLTDFIDYNLRQKA
ncbi:MAG TPA: integration host factor subunit alpha, partial [Sutterellaceae bacterium]|nr:integration host factor subunit alpha [Sutterellaceae bacterium]